jgi:uncharacterized protein YbjT (DUF2867 family)
MVTVHRTDMLDPGFLSAIGDGYTTAYYLVHSMGRGGGSDYEARDASAASNFARFATAAGIQRVLYLGGLGDRPASKHLRSRLRVGEILRDEGPPLTWFRAGMVVGRQLRELPYAALARGALAGHARSFVAVDANPGDRHRRPIRHGAVRFPATTV